MNPTVVRYQTHADAAGENQRLVEEVFAELAEDAPEGLRYMVLRLDDGVTFIHIVASEDDDSPLTRTAAFKEFQRGVGERVAGPPQRASATVVGSYRFIAE